MMQLELYDHLGHPLIIPCRRVVIRNEHGTILGAAIEYQPGLCSIAHYAEPSLDRLLQVMGIARTEVDIKPAPLRDLNEIVFPQQ